MYSGLRTGASLVFDLDGTLRSAFDRRVGWLEDQVSSTPTRRDCKHEANLQPRGVARGKQRDDYEGRHDPGESVADKSYLPFFVQLL